MKEVYKGLVISVPAVRRQSGDGPRPIASLRACNDYLCCRVELLPVNKSGQVRKRPIVLKKSFWGDDPNFSGLLMRFPRGDMGDHIVSHKNVHGASSERYGVLQWWGRLKISFCEIFGVVQFSTFATLSARGGP